MRFDAQVSYQYFEALREQCQGALICLIKMDRMSRRLAAKAAAQEEAGKHTYATYVAIEAVAKCLLAQRHVTSLCPCTSPQTIMRLCIGPMKTV